MSIFIYIIDYIIYSLLLISSVAFIKPNLASFQSQIMKTFKIYGNRIV